MRFTSQKMVEKRKCR